MGETRHSHSNPHIFLWKATSLMSSRDRIKRKGKGRWEPTQTCYRQLSFWARPVASLISLLHILSPSHTKEITIHASGQVPIGGYTRSLCCFLLWSHSLCYKWGRLILLIPKLLELTGIFVIKTFSSNPRVTAESFVFSS